KMLGLLRKGLPEGEATAFVVGIVVAALVGYGAIRFLLGYVQKNSFNLFIYYRLAFGGIILGLLLFRG
ncbi:MAG TPA: undecaprenyl-diphosphate phosphatase, partial [Chloroflexota bacterium]|nr:undecaprenyl-diphosphate phosphatase [Chloroflexota bacterium]